MHAVCDFILQKYDVYSIGFSARPWIGGQWPALSFESDLAAAVIPVVANC